jgi:hypothetical protein
MSAKQQDLIIEQGKTFQRTVRWETAPRVWKPITGITNAAPATITCPTHGVPDGWRVGVVDVEGMDQINAGNNPPRDGDLREATVASANTLQLDLSSLRFDTYTSGGSIVYWTPHTLAGYTARMTIKDRVGGSVLATVACTVDDTLKTIALLIDATASAAFTFKNGVYDLELVSGSGIVTALLAGSVTVTQEVTT